MGEVTMKEPRSPIQALVAPAAARNILVGHRFVRSHDDLALRADEAESFANSIAKVRRLSGAARIVARNLLQELGVSPCSFPKDGRGAPIFPPGVVGSLAHSDDIAVAAVALDTNGLSIGVDIEPDVDLPDGLIEMVATPNELRRYHGEILRSRLLFVAKEAVYKATFPLDRQFLDFLDVEIDLDRCLAHTRSGMNCQIFFAPGAYLAALAAIDVPMRDRN
jgi:4'-phosphopantetheinyl transferase EntD